MSFYTFKKLNLKYGDIIYIVNEKVEGFYRSYEDDYDEIMESYKFQNHSNGQTETIYINTLQ